MPDIGITNLANNPFGNGSSSDYGHMSPETSFGYQNAYSNYLTDFFKANPDMFGKTDAQHYQSQKDNFMAQMASNPTTAEAFKINQSTPTKPFINPHEGHPASGMRQLWPRLPMLRPRKTRHTKTAWPCSKPLMLSRPNNEKSLR